jgi:TonB family protein
MISTAAARSAFDASAVDASFTWTFPGAPLRINIPFELIARLKADMSTTESDDVPKVEIGGILLGNPGKSTVEIRDYVLAFRGQHSPVHYSVNVAVLEILRQADSALSVVGYFRTQSEGTLQLREDEVELIGKHFREPSDVVLLLQTSCEPDNAGFLCWNEGVFLPYSFMEFPFDSELLRREIEARLLSPAIARDETGEASTALEAPPPGTAIRPHFSRRTMLTAGLAAGTLMLGLTAFMLRDRWLPARNRPVIPQVSTVSFPLEVEPQGTGLNLRWNPQSIPTGKAVGGVLEIREGEQSPQLIGLNPEQLAVGHIYYQSAAQRIEFRLEVSDAAGPIAKGAVLALLSPPAVVPSAQMHPADQVPARKVQSVPIIATGTNFAARKSTGVIEKSSEAPRRFFAPQPLQKGAEPAKPIVDATAPELVNAANARPVPLPETPGGLSAALRLPPLNPPSRAPNPVPAETASAPPPQASRTPASTTREPAKPAIQPVIQSALQPPLPARKVQPILRPAISAQIPPNTDIEVTVRAQIDATGRVVKADVLREHPAQGGVYAQLEIAALDAIRQWRFSPARMGNVLVPSDYAITFHFQKH